MSHLSDNDRQALELARDLRANMQQWLTRQGSTGSLSISPFVDPTGRPSVIITMDSTLALAMVNSFEQQSVPAPAPAATPPPALAPAQQQPVQPLRHSQPPAMAPAAPLAPMMATSSAAQHYPRLPVPSQALR